MSALPPLNGLKAFEAAARTGSFASAARELHVAPSAVSRLVKVLEGRLGKPLFTRHARALTLTAAGQRYHREVAAAFEKIRQATNALRAPQPDTLVLGAGPTLAMRWLIPRLPAFQALHRNIEVRISTSIESAEPMKDDWTAAIRIGSGTWPGFDTQLLFTADMYPVCTPALAKSLRSPRDLARANLLQNANAPEDWELWLKAAGVDEVDLSHALVFDYPAFALQAALDGVGVALARAPFVADDIAAKRLVRPFPQSVPKGKGWYLVSRHAERGNEALGKFRTWLLSEARKRSRKSSA